MMQHNKICSLDIESNNLLESSIDFSLGFPLQLAKTAKLWCISITDFTDENDMKTITLVHRTIKQTRNWLKTNLINYDMIVLHNGHKFDLPLLKLFGLLDYTIGYLGKSDTIYGKNVQFIDTLIISRLLNPNRKGGHSLKVWGKRVGLNKIDYRENLVNIKALDIKAAKGAEFRMFHPTMVEYCEVDTKVTALVFTKLMEDWNTEFSQGCKIEHKLADLAINREMFGFDFDEDLAYDCLEDLDEKMNVLRDNVNPLLPPKKLTQSELGQFTPPKNQIRKDGTLSSHMERFIEKHNVELIVDTITMSFNIKYKNNVFTLPHTEPLETHRVADIADLDHIKHYLIELGWIPSEWAVRDLTKDSQKKEISLEKRVKALDRYMKETWEGKYQKLRCKNLGIFNKNNKSEYLFAHTELKGKLNGKFPVKVNTSPKIKVGVMKELCPNLLKLGDKVAFANDFALYLTYKHRRSCIANKDFIYDPEIEGVPEKGYLQMLRTDGRVSTPAIEIGAATHRYRHVKISNLARASSIYGKEIRSLFGAGEGYLQLGFDYNSLENRVQGGYVKKYPQGEELAERLVAEKPNDLHTVTGKALGISRGDAKSMIYGITYGAGAKKVASMFNKTLEEAEVIYNGFWNSVPALKNLKEDLTKEWHINKQKYITTIDGRQILTRSEHSLLNFLFQSTGVICAKYASVFLMEILEEKGYKINPFTHEPDVCSMIEYHDEQQLAFKKSLKLAKVKHFNTKEEAKEYHANYTGKNQLSTIKKYSNKNLYYICKPNDISISIEDATKRTQKILNLKFELGFEYDVSTNWYECH